MLRQDVHFHLPRVSCTWNHGRDTVCALCQLCWTATSGSACWPIAEPCYYVSSRFKPCVNTFTRLGIPRACPLADNWLNYAGLRSCDSSFYCLSLIRLEYSEKLAEKFYDECWTVAFQSAPLDKDSLHTHCFGTPNVNFGVITHIDASFGR